MSARRPRILLVAYYFPPVGGGGVSRTLKALAALGAAGFEPWVLTVDDAAWTRDPALLARVAPGTRVLRIPNPDWGRVAARRPEAPRAARARAGGGRLRRLLVPDLHVGWSALAAPVAAALAAARAVDLVYVSAPPYSAFAAGLAAGRLGVPWIADFRDGWTCCPTRRDLPPRRVAVERRLEEGVLHRAHRVLFASPGPRARYAQRVPGLEARSETMLSGYDPQEFAAARAVWPAAGPLELVHAGSVLTNRREATLGAVLDALASPGAGAPGAAPAIRLRLLGAEPEVAARVRAAGLEGCVRVEPGVGRDRLGAEIARAHGALVLAPPGSRGAEPIPGKLFDAAGAGRPVLAVSEAGPLPRLVTELGLGRAVGPGDPRGLRAELRAAAERAARGALAWPVAGEGLAALASPRCLEPLLRACRELLAAREVPCPSPSAS